MPIVTGYIDPIPADAVQERLAQMCQVALAPALGLTVPTLVDGKIDDKTIAYARECAQKVVADMSELPHTQQAGDLLSLAYTVLRFTGDTDGR